MYGHVKSLKKACKECGYALIQITRKGKRPQEVCINPECPSKKISEEEKKKAEEAEKVCPKCGKKLVLRKSIYGQFYGCSGYPKCRYTEKIEE